MDCRYRHLPVFAGIFASTLAGPAFAQPTGGTVVSGQASITAPSGATTLINQASQKAIINWQDFSVAAGQTVRFAQPNASAITLNRVTGGAVSNIQGAVRANGQVWLINPNGVLFGQGARLNVGGLLATTADIANSDFLSGNYAFTSTGSSGSIVNNGSIRAAKGGSVVLSAPQVTNKGLIQANAGHVVLGGAEAFTVDFNGDHLLSYAVTTPVSKTTKDASGNDQSAVVSNSGIIRAAGGKILLTARAAANVAAGVLNNTGIVEATSAHMEGGDIVLDAGDGTVQAGGTLDASGKAAGESGGSIQVLGQTVAVADGAKIDVSGDAGGGQVLIGGNFHGAGPQQNAVNTTVGKATINADAIHSGSGGKVAVWSGGRTTFAGTITAKGGAKGGDGGQVETSGHDLQVSDSAAVNTLAPQGMAGIWLLDPRNIVIANVGSDPVAGETFSSNVGGSVTISPFGIATALASGNVTLQANTDITVSQTINVLATTANTLAMQAGRSITVNAPINYATGRVTLSANDPGATASDRISGAAVLGGTGSINAASIDLINSSNGGDGSSISATVGGGALYIKTGGASATISANTPNGILALGNSAHTLAVDMGAGNLTLVAGGVTQSAPVSVHNLTVSYDPGITAGSGVLLENSANRIAGTLNIQAFGGLPASDFVDVAVTNNLTIGIVTIAPDPANGGTARGSANFSATGLMTLTGNIDAGSVGVSGPNIVQTGGRIFAHADLSGNAAGELDIFTSGTVSLLNSNVVESVVKSTGNGGETAVTQEAEVDISGPGSATVNLVSNVGLFADVGGSVSLTATGTYSLLNPAGTSVLHNNGIDLVDDIDVSGQLTLHATGDVIQQSGSRNLSVGNGLNVTSDQGAIAMMDGGDADGDRGNKVRGAVVFNSAGDTNFTNTVDTILGGAIYFPLVGGVQSQPSFPYSGAVGPAPANTSPVSSTIGGSLTVLVTDANEAAGSHSVLDVTGYIHVLNTNGGTSTLHATGNLISNTVSGFTPGTIYSGTSAHNNLNLISDFGSIGQDSDYLVSGVAGPATAFSIGTGGSVLNLQAAAQNGDIWVNDDSHGVNIGIAGLPGGLRGNSVFVNGGGTVGISQNIDSSGTILSVIGFQASSPGPVNLANTHNAANGEIRLNSPGAITFFNSVNTLIKRIYNTSTASVINPAGNITIKVDDPSGATAPTLTLSNVAGGPLSEISIHAAGRVTLTADGNISDGYLANPATAGFIIAKGGLSATSTKGSISLVNGGVGTGNQVTGPVIFNSFGDTSFVNTVDTILGGPLFFPIDPITGQSQPNFPFAGPVGPPPDGVSPPPSFIIGGNLNVLVTDANELLSPHSTLDVSGIINAKNSNGGYSSLHATGDIVHNSFDGGFTGRGIIIVGHSGLDNNLSLTSDFESIGDTDSTSDNTLGANLSLFFAGTSGGALNLHALAPNGSASIGAFTGINVGVTGLLGGVQAGESVSLVSMNGSVIQNLDSSGTLAAGLSLIVHSEYADSTPGAITLTNPRNAVVGPILLLSSDSTFYNSVDTILRGASDGRLDQVTGSFNPVQAGSVTVRVLDPDGDGEPTLTLYNGTFTDPHGDTQTPNTIEAGSAILTAGGGITDGYDAGNPDTFATAGSFAVGSLQLNSLHGYISLTNPVSSGVSGSGTLTFDGGVDVAINYAATNLILERGSAGGGVNLAATGVVGASPATLELAGPLSAGNAIFLHASGTISQDNGPDGGLTDTSVHATLLSATSDEGSIVLADGGNGVTDPGNAASQAFFQAPGDVTFYNTVDTMLGSVTGGQDASFNPLAAGNVTIVVHASSGDAVPSLTLGNYTYTDPDNHQHTIGIYSSAAVLLKADGDISDGYDSNPGLAGSVKAAAGLTVTSIQGNIFLVNGGNGGADRGNQVSGPVIFNSAGDTSFVNTVDTILGGPVYYPLDDHGDQTQPNFPYNGPVGPQPPGYTPPSSTIGGNLTVLVTDANEAPGHHSVLVLAGRIHGAADHGDVTLRATGDLINNSGAGTILTGTDPTSLLHLVSDYGTIGGSDGTNWSFGLGSDGGVLNLEAEALNGNIVINPGDLNIAGGLQAHQITIFGNGIVSQAGDSSAITADTLDVHATADITLDNPRNAVTGQVNFRTSGNITFYNSVDTFLARASGDGLDDSNNPLPAQDVTIVVEALDDAKLTLTLGNSVDTGTDGNPHAASIESSGSVFLQAEGRITDGYDAGNPDSFAGAGHVVAATGLQVSGGVVSLTNPVNSFPLFGAATNDQDVSVTATSPSGVLALIGQSGDFGIDAGNGNVKVLAPGQDVVADIITAGNLDISGKSITVASAEVDSLSARTGGGLISITSPSGLFINNLAGGPGIDAAGGLVLLTALSVGQDEGSGGEIHAGLLQVTTSGTEGGELDLFNHGNAVTGPIRLTSASDASLFNSVTTYLDSSETNGFINGTLLVQSAGDLILDPGAHLETNVEVGDSTVLVAGGRFINNSGPHAIDELGARFLIYSQDPSLDGFNGLDSENTAVWGTVYPNPVTAAGDRYVFATQPTLTVTSTDVTKTAGSDASLAVANAYTVTGLQPGVSGAFLGDTEAQVYSGTPLVFSPGASADADAGSSPYTIFVNPGSLTVGDNYQVQFHNNGLLTINTASVLSYVADTVVLIYGQTLPIFHGTLAGDFLPGDSPTSLGVPIFTAEAAPGSGVGTYAILGSGIVSSRYTFVQAPGNYTALTINPATLVYNAIPSQRTYGATDPAFDGTVTGLVNGDTVESLGTLTWTSNADVHSGVGAYGILGSGLASPNYNFVQAESNFFALTINPATLTYKADTVSRAYGTNNPELGGEVDGFVNGDNLDSLEGHLGFSTEASAGTSVGSYEIRGFGLSSGNYQFVQYSGNGTALTINPAVLTYKAEAATRTYGGADPALTGSVEGNLFGDDRMGGELVFTTSASSGSNVGSYAILGAGLDAGSNYTFVQAASNFTAFTITPATLTAATVPFSRTYGSSAANYTVNVTGFVNGDTNAVLTGTTVFSTPATAASPVGSYALDLIAATGLRNYTIVQAPGNATALSITPATLTYVATAASRAYGAANPAVTGTVQGFVNGETTAVLTSAPVFTAAALSTSDVGSYAITGSGAAAQNYVFVQAAANSAAFLITPATLTTALTGTVSKQFDGTTAATLTAANFAVLSGVVGNDNVQLVFPLTGTYDTASAGIGKTVTAAGLSLSGTKALDYNIASSVSGPVGTITALPADSVASTPVLVGFTAATQSFITPPTSFTITFPSDVQGNPPPPPPPALFGPTGALPPSNQQNPLATLASGSGDQSPPEPTTPSDRATDYVVKSLDGGAPPPGTERVADTVLIPGMLHAISGHTQTQPDSGDDLSAWGNSALWQ